MSEWITKELNDCGIEIIDGDRGANYPSRQEFKSEGYCIFLSTSNIVDDKFQLDHCDFISQQRDVLLRKGKLTRNDIVLTTRGTVGSVAFYHQGISFDNVRINSGMVILRSDKTFDSTFLYHLFKSSLLKQQYELFASGSAQPQLPIKDLKRIKLTFPPLTIQRKIAAILSAYDDLIENNTRRIALLEKMAEEIYREWFVRLRFPGHERVPVHQGVPEGWESTSVDGAFEIIGGGTPSKEENRLWIGGAINWFTPSDITAAEGIFLSSSGMQCTEEGLSKSSARLFPAYSLMMTSRATIGALGINTTPACTNQGFITCIPNAKFPFTYLYFWLKMNKEYFELLSTGSTFLELIKSNFRKIRILMPSHDVTASYHKANLPVFKLIETLLQDNHNLKKTRDMLLSRLLSGKLDVGNLDVRFPPGMSEPAAAHSQAAAGGKDE